jgi:hypothetical protein
MSEKPSYTLSSAGVLISAIGTFSQEQIVSLLGFLLTLAIHMWNGRQTKGELPKVRAELEYWKGRAYAIDGRADQLSAELKELKRRYEPAAVTPPFLPAESATDCIEREA